MRSTGGNPREAGKFPFDVDHQAQEQSFLRMDQIHTDRECEQTQQGAGDPKLETSTRVQHLDVEASSALQLQAICANEEGRESQGLEACSRGTRAT